jgi:hypothetical protein
MIAIVIDMSIAAAAVVVFFYALMLMISGIKLFVSVRFNLYSVVAAITFSSPFKIDFAFLTIYILACCVVFLLYLCQRTAIPSSLPVNM